ncbi:MAG TPA: VOC family protein [Candidatus Limnocylindria bacterium]|nr:VOC family protein [Candidatus Limnocylindria bacterium]
MPPKYAQGKICYIEIPANDVRQSAEFFRKIFGWEVRTRDDGSVGFDDGVGEVSGTWVVGRPPSVTPGVLIHIMVVSVEATVEAIVAQGGVIVQGIGGDAPEITARFRDPGGNVFSIYQERALQP